MGDVVSIPRGRSLKLLSVHLSCMTPESQRNLADCCLAILLSLKGKPVVDVDRLGVGTHWSDCDVHRLNIDVHRSDVDIDQ